MNKSLILLLVLGVCGSTMAATPKRYVMKQMDCIGKIDENGKARAHESYHNFGLRLIAFKSKRKDGSFADSLGWNTFYGETLNEVLQEMKDNRGGSEVWYSGQLRQQVTRQGLTVWYKDITRPDLMLVVKKRTAKVDLLAGRFYRLDTPIGSYSYELRCQAYR